MPVTTTHRWVKTQLRTGLFDSTLFDDIHLIRLLTEARADGLVYSDICRCLVGLSNYGYYDGIFFDTELAHRLGRVEFAFNCLGSSDEHRNRRLIPIILHAMKLRARQPVGRVAQLSMAPSMAPATKFQMVD